MLALCVALIGASMSPFERRGFDARLVYATLMSVLVLYALQSRRLRIDLLMACVLCIQVVAIGLAMMFDGQPERLLTISTLCSVAVVGILFWSRLLDITAFAKVCVLLTLGVAAAAAASTVLAYFGYLEPVPVFERPGTETTVETIYRVGLTLTNEVTSLGDGYFIRPGGVFIEPGQLAMWVSLALILNAVVLGRRVYEGLLACLGLFTSALSFVLFLTLFLVAFRRWRALQVCGTALVILTVWGGLATFAQSESYLAYGTVRRVVTFFDEGVGGNRFQPTLTVLTQLNKLNVVGSIEGNPFGDPAVDATVWGPFIGYGWLGGMAAYGHLMLFAVVPLAMLSAHPKQIRPRTNMFRVFVLLVVSLYHRPYTLHFLYYVYLIALFEWEWRKYADTMPAQFRVA